MTSNLLVKRTNSPNLTLNYLKKVDLLLSYWLRMFSNDNESNESSKKPTLFPLDLASLISDYQKYVCIFDIYNKLTTNIQNNKHNQIMTIKSSNVSIFSSLHIKNTNNVSIKLIKFTSNNSYCNLSMGYITSCDINYTNNYCGFLTNPGMAYGSVGNDYKLVRFYGKKNGHYWLNDLDTVNLQTIIKENDIFKMEYLNTKFTWYLNGKKLYSKVSNDNMYFVISCSQNGNDFIVLNVK